MSIQPYTLNGVGRAWLAASLLDLTRRLVEPVHGPFDLFFHIVYAGIVGIPVTLSVLALGAVLFIPMLNKVWYPHRWAFWMLFTLGCSMFVTGVFLAHHAHFTLHETSSVSNSYLINAALPGGLLVVFAVCFDPFRKKRVMPTEPTMEVNSTLPSENNLDRYLRKKEVERQAALKNGDNGK